MKFCKNLQRVVDISNAEWAPYYVNYKFLKKLIKELPSLVPADEGGNRAPNAATQDASTSTAEPAAPTTASTASSTSHSHPTCTVQQHGDKTAEGGGEAASATESESQQVPAGSASTQQQQSLGSQQPQSSVLNAVEQRREVLGRNPGEKAFFKLLHQEVRKASHFFSRAQQEFVIREERVREGMEIMKQPNSIMVAEKWSMLARSIYKLYKDLLLLETFAIMTYCSFSKILKKHDKVTGHQTRAAFMKNVVNRANFTNYPTVLQMIERCEQLYDEASKRLLQEGKQCLYEDERLFINMISRLNEQVLTSNGEGMQGAAATAVRRKQQSSPGDSDETATAASGVPSSASAAAATSTDALASVSDAPDAAEVKTKASSEFASLETLVEAHQRLEKNSEVFGVDIKARAVSVTHEEEKDEDRKRPAEDPNSSNPSSTTAEVSKKPRTE